MAAATTVGKMG